MRAHGCALSCQTQSTERLSSRCLWIGLIGVIISMSMLAFLLHWQLLTLPIEATEHYVPKPMLEMVTGWETVDYFTAVGSSSAMQDQGLGIQ